MSKKLEVYKCDVCGNIVELFHVGKGTLVCCGKPMVLQSENTVDAAIEKHKPIINKLNDGYEVIVGSTLHPMTKEHYIEWVELIVGDTVYTKFFSPTDEPKATFKVSHSEDIVARAYCNLHGHWKS